MINEFLINNKYTFNGKWFFPSNIKIIFYGQLIYNHSEESPIIQLWIDKKLELDDLIKNNTILGYSTDSNKITLTNISFKSSSQSLLDKENLTSCIFNVYGSVIIGNHYKEINDIQIQEIYYNFTGFSNFIIHKKMKRDVTIKKIKIEYENPENYNFYQNENFIYEILFTYSTNLLGRNANIQLRDYLRIKSLKKIVYQEILDQLEIFNNFLIFFTNKRSNVTEIFSIDKSKTKVFYLNYWNRKIELPELNQGMAGSIICTLFEDKTKEYFKNWLELYNRQKSAIEKYFSILSNDKYYIEEKFLLYIQVFEDFHRNSAKFINLMNDDDEYQEKVKSILENCPKEYLEWLETELKIRNEIPLGNRLHQLIKIFKRIYEVYLNIKSNNKNIVVDKIVKTRNYMTHRSTESEKYAVKDLEELITLTELVKTFIDTIIFYELGFTIEEISHNIFCKEDFHDLIRKVQDHKLDWEMST